MLFNCDGTDVQYGAALNKNTGQLVWKTNRSGVITKPKDRKKAFVTPLVIHDGRRELAIMTAAEWVYAYEPRTGKEIWHVKHPGFSVAPRPVFGHGLVYVCTGYMLPQLLAIRPEGTGDLTDTGVAWKIDKSVPAKPSPLLVGDELYLVSDGGLILCHDALTGKLQLAQTAGRQLFNLADLRRWPHLLLQRGGPDDGRGPDAKEYKELAVNQLDGRFMASPAVAGNALYLRTDTHLYRIEE